MASTQAEIRLQSANDMLAVNKLNEQTFGPGRFARTAYRIREQAACDPRLSLCTFIGSEIIGAIQFTPLRIGETGGALLLGPLIVSGAHSNQGHGLRLMLEGLKLAAELAYSLVILVGDPPYYGRAGFAAVPPHRITLPGPVDPARLLYVELTSNALALYRGQATGLQI